MTWLTDKSIDRSLDALLALRPPLQKRFQAFYSSLWKTGLVTPRLLELCRLRVAAIHDCVAEWATRDPAVDFSDAELEALRRGQLEPFTAAERAALVVTDRLPFQHHELTDSEVAELKSHLGDACCVSLLNGLVLFDVNCRLQLTFGISRGSIQSLRGA